MNYQKQIGILGAGESGIGAALLAQEKGYLVFVSEFGRIGEQARSELEASEISYEEGGHSLERLADSSLIIKSPGISDDVPIVQALRRRKVPIISEIEFAAQHSNARLIAITGTNGKTTTASLTYHVLQAAGLDVKLAGNIGKSFARSLTEGEADYFVLEVSSFQLDNITDFHPQIAVILNITPDHLDRYHNSMYEYVSAKLRITENQTSKDLFIYNAKDYWTIQNLQNLTGNPQLVGINLKSRDNSVAYWHKERNQLEVKEDHFDLNTLSLRGEHNYFNITTAVLIAQRLGISRERIQQSLDTFKGRPHRLEKVTELQGITFFNDSKATNVDASLQALSSFRQPIVWIAGGVDKGNEYKLLEQVVEAQVHSLIALGTDNKKLLDFFAPRIPQLYQTRSMEEAVATAFRIAPPGSVVLLSPACASFDLFQNYQHRGDCFKRCILELSQEK